MINLASPRQRESVLLVPSASASTESSVLSRSGNGASLETVRTLNWREPATGTSADGRAASPHVGDTAVWAQRRHGDWASGPGFLPRDSSSPHQLGLMHGRDEQSAETSRGGLRETLIRLQSVSSAAVAIMAHTAPDSLTVVDGSILDYSPHE
ncbi:hypothetical protein N7539_003536 [Penicillium diatomitis]|uniref:Uncharacterized protein n=1 Tax=Penicillium diatomitis TaxID=2819901 RepID=A0A9W9XC88_9EURO|nr:uncharacterized protein N7539_003536 [Penicillium diatomitis]KAJ5488646.1 hypothetical protein N7539_003536 [Penicillium diatomitis]